MKKTISAFLTVGFVLSIILVVLGGLFVILGAVGIAGGAVANEQGVDPNASTAFAASGITLLIYGILFVIFGVANLVGMVKIRNAWPKVTEKAQAKKLAIWSIVLGALFTEFPIVSGILMLAMPEEQYKQK